MDSKRTVLLLFPGDSRAALQPSAASCNSSKPGNCFQLPLQNLAWVTQGLSAPYQEMLNGFCECESCQHTLSLPCLPPQINSFQAVKDSSEIDCDGEDSGGFKGVDVTVGTKVSVQA